MKHRMNVFATVLICATMSCGKPSGDVPAPESMPGMPALLLVESEISGSVLGANLDRPYGLASDHKGNVYVVDAGNNRLIRFTPQFVPERDFGGYGVEGGLLDRPTYIAFDNGLNLMVSDEGNRRVSRYNSRLNFVDEVNFYDDADPLKFGYPSGIAFTEYGETWVADRDNNQIAVFSSVGGFDRFLGDYGYAGGQLSSPEKIARDQRGNFIVCDAGNRRLVIYDKFGNFDRQLELPETQYPGAVATTEKALWVLDRNAGVVQCVAYDGTVLFEAGPTIPGTDRRLTRPSDILILSPQRLLISDSGNNRILVCRISYRDN